MASNPVMSFDEATGRWQLVRSPSKASHLCQVRYCRNGKPKRGLVCSRCQMRKWRRNNPVYACFRMVELNARRRGIPFLLTLEEFTAWAEEHCYISLRGNASSALTIDREDNSKGYSLDNIQPMTKRDNVRKGDKPREVYDEPEPSTFTPTDTEPF